MSNIATFNAGPLIPAPPLSHISDGEAVGAIANGPNQTAIPLFNPFTYRMRQKMSYRGATLGSYPHVVDGFSAGARRAYGQRLSAGTLIATSLNQMAPMGFFSDDASASGDASSLTAADLTPSTDTTSVIDGTTTPDSGTTPSGASLWSQLPSLITGAATAAASVDRAFNPNTTPIVSGATGAVKAVTSPPTSMNTILLIGGAIVLVAMLMKKK